MFLPLGRTADLHPFADAADLDSTPELTAVRESVPHSWLLPLCDAVLHAGGAGTTNASLLAGCPQLVCPLHFDQFSWVGTHQSVHHS